MADRKTTPDVLGSLLGGDTEPTKKPADQNTIKPEYHNAGIPAYHKDSKTVDQPTIKTVSHKKKPAKVQKASGDKIKATYYIASETVDSLEDGWIRLRKISPKEVRGQISKSLIVELAIQMALDELETKGKESRLVKRIS